MVWVILGSVLMLKTHTIINRRVYSIHVNSNLKFHDAGKPMKQISFSRRTSENKNLLHTNKRKQKPSYPLLKAIAVSFQALKFPEISTLVCLSLLLFTRCFACHGNYSLGPLLSKPKSVRSRLRRGRDVGSHQGFQVPARRRHQDERTHSFSSSPRR